MRKNKFDIKKHENMKTLTFLTFDRIYDTFDYFKNNIKYIISKEKKVWLFLLKRHLTVVPSSKILIFITIAVVLFCRKI